MIDAENSSGAVRALRQKKLFPLEVKPFSGSDPRGKKLRKIKPKDVTIFTRQISDLIRSGFTVSKALHTLSTQTSASRFSQVISDLYLKLNKGKTFSQALSLYPSLFSPFYLSMIRIGEKSGTLDLSLEKLAESREKQQEIFTQIRSALAYPLFLLAVGIITVFVLVSFVIPKLAVMFEDLGQALPLPTQIVMNFSSFMSSFWWAIVIAACVFIFFVRSYYLKEKNRTGIDRWFLSLPGLHILISKVEISNFLHGLGMLLSHGVPVIDALAVLVPGVNNFWLREKFSLFSEKIRKGRTLRSCFLEDAFFPPVLADMAGIGEESGDLAQTMLNIADNYEKEINAALKAMVSLIEPVLILILGSVIALLAFAMLLPVFDINFLVE